MTRRRSQRPAAGAPDAQDLPADLDDLDPTGVIAELGDAAQLITLYRQDPTAPTRYAFLDSFPADGFTLAGVRDSYGGGNYRIHVRDGTRKVRRQLGFSIAGPAKLPALPAPSDAPPSRAHGSADSQELREVVKALQDTVKSLAAAQTRPQADPMELAVKIAAGFQTAQTNAFQQLQALQGDGGKRAGMSVADMRELIELGAERAAQGPAADPVVDLAARLGPPLLGLIAQGLQEQKAARMAAAGSGGLPAGVVGHIPPAAAPADGGAVAPDLGARIRPYLGMLLHMARADADPDPLAVTIAQVLPAAEYEALAGLLAAPDAMVQVLSALPELAAYEGWTARLLDALRDELAGDGGDDTDTETPATAVQA